jgi:hypothetical protein
MHWQYSSHSNGTRAGIHTLTLTDGHIEKWQGDKNVTERAVECRFVETAKHGRYDLSVQFVSVIMITYNRTECRAPCRSRKWWLMAAMTLLGHTHTHTHTRTPVARQHRNVYTRDVLYAENRSCLTAFYKCARDWLQTLPFQHRKLCNRNFFTVLLQHFLTNVPELCHKRQRGDRIYGRLTRNVQDSTIRPSTFEGTERQLQWMTAKFYCVCTDTMWHNTRVTSAKSYPPYSNNWLTWQ